MRSPDIFFVPHNGKSVSFLLLPTRGRPLCEQRGDTSHTTEVSVLITFEQRTADS
jgi:hypothetical protein